MNFKELVRVGKDAEVRATNGGKYVTSFSAAFDNGWGDRKQTVWLDCSYWGERGRKVAEYIKKGSQLVVEGDIGTREYEGKTYLTLNVGEIKLVGRTQSGNDRTQGGSAPAKAPDDFNDDIPW